MADSLEYWKTQAESFKKRYEESQEELEEFQQQSRELEAELETQLDQFEKKNRDLNVANELTSRERDTLRTKLESSQSDSVRQLSRVEEQLNRVTAHRDELQRYIRELEQSNDDLERAKRNVSAMVEDFEKRMNETLERNALLESELDEKSTLHEYIQRLKEEARDLRQEISARELMATKVTMPKSESDMDIDAPNEKQRVLSRSRTTDASWSGHVPVSSKHSTPSSRISALNIVGDLLRKVGALETKLASCRKYASEEANGGPEAKQPHLSNSSTPTNGHNGKKSSWRQKK